MTVLQDGPNQDFVTFESLSKAEALATKFAQDNPDFTGSQCAERAVRAIFGRWLLDWSGTIRPDRLPFCFHLINKVENRLDLHRRPRQRSAAPIPPLPRHAPIPLPPRPPVVVHAALALAA